MVTQPGAAVARRNGAAASHNPYRKDDRLLFAEVVTRRQRKVAAARAQGKASLAASPAGSGVEEGRVAVDAAQVLKNKPESRLKWLQNTLLLPSLHEDTVTAIYDLVANPKFVAGTDDDVRKQMREAVLASIHVFSPSQQSFIQSDASFLSKSGLDDGFFEGAAQAAMQRMMAVQTSVEPQEGRLDPPVAERSRSPSAGSSCSREPSPPVQEEIVARSATVRPKRAAAPPSRPTTEFQEKSALLEGFLRAAASVPVPQRPAAEPAANRLPQRRSRSRSASPDRPCVAERPSSPAPAPVQGEKKAILEGFLAAVGLAPPPERSRQASDLAYEPEDAAVAEPALAEKADGGDQPSERVRFKPKPLGHLGGQAAKNSAASAVNAALSNIKQQAAAARAAADALMNPPAKKESGAEAADADATVAAAMRTDGSEAGHRDRSNDSSRKERRPEASPKKDRDRDRDKDKDRDRSRSRRRRRRSSSGSRGRRRGRSRSRSRSNREVRRKGRRFSLDDEAPSLPLVNASDQQAAEHLAMARRMTTIVGTVGEQRLRPGDWTCPICNAHNFASKFQCFRCAKAKNPFLEGVFNLPHNIMGVGCEPTPQMMKVGDWLCARCSAHNFASKFQCFRCGQGKNPMLADSNVQLNLPTQAQIGGRSAAGLALKAAAMAGKSHFGPTAAQAAHAQGFSNKAPQGFSNAPPPPPSGFSQGQL